MKKIQYTFSDLVDIPALQEMLDNLYIAAQIPSAIIDMEGNILAGAGWQTICLEFHRKHPETEKLCIKSDTHIRNEISSGAPYVIYECPHGLVDSSCPLMIDGEHIANVFTGQLLHSPLDEEKRKYFIHQAQQYGFNEDDYLDALSEVPVFSLEKHKAILDVLSKLAGQIAKMGLANLKIEKQKKIIEESEKIYRSLFKDSYTIMMIVDPISFEIVDANSAACSFYGYNLDEITKVKITDINQLPKNQIIAEMTKAGERQCNSFYFKHKLASGEMRDVEVHSGPIIRSGKELLYSIVHDITERKLAEEALNKAALEWTTAMDASEDAIYLLDPQRKLLRANKVFYHVTGSKPQSAIGMHITDIIHPQGESVPCPVCRAQEELSDATITLEADHPDNPAERPIEVTIKVVRDELKQPVSIFMRLHDLTEQRKTENILRKREEEWEKTFNAMGDIITIQDKNMKIIKANKAAHEAFNVTSGELNGRYCYEVFREAKEPCPNCPEIQTINEGITHGTNITHKNLGKTFHVTSSPVFDEDGKFEHIIHIAKDITEHKKMEEELFQAHKMEAIGTLAGGIAHDFNNILAAIIGYADLARGDLPDDCNAKEYIKQVLGAGNRAKELVKQILAFSRKSHEKQCSLQPSPIIKEALKLLRASLPSSVTIKEKIASDCGTVWANPTNLHQVLVNLCTNSLHAMENQKGVLTVKLSQVYLFNTDLPNDHDMNEGDYVEVIVEDTGHGMDNETVSRIFEPYFTNKKAGKGTGMGLSLVHSIVKNCGGFIRVESELGIGTTMYVYFPIVDDDSESYDDDIHGQLERGSERVLIVDDEQTIVTIYQNILEQLGYAVTKTTSSKKALELFIASPREFDLIITDQTMPEYTGDELAERILQLRPDIPIVLCTGYSSLASNTRAKMLGIKKFLMKPVDRMTLSKTVREALDAPNQTISTY